MNKTVIGVRFKEVGKVYYFDPGEEKIEAGNGVIVETVRGVEFGEVVLSPREVEENKIIKPLKSIIKKADEKDYAKLESNKKKEQEAFELCAEKIRKHNMQMKLINVEYTFDGNKIIFYFTADGRVDFRELVKDLAGIFKTRIELRQIGVRDETKMLGGLGPCGRPCCCSQFLGDFQPVSIRMAKEQNLSLSPTKISGLCGRLMCCLNYENEHYKCLRHRLPKVGSIIHTLDGDAEVLETNAITETVRARITLPDNSAEVKKYTLAEIEVRAAAVAEDDDILESDEMKSILDE